MPTIPSTRAVVSLLSADDAAVSLAAEASEEPEVAEAPFAVEPWLSSSEASEASDRVRVGAGFSGSSWPFCGISIQRTTSLLEYVWSALKTSWSVLSGRAPTESGNFWK